VSRRRVTIHDLLAEARRLIARLTPADAYRAQSEGAVLVDTRSEDQRREQGVIPGALHCPLSVLEWHLDPDSGHSAPGISLDSWVILVCSEGYSSSLAAARLLALGFARATDVIGGVEAWKAAGLPMVESPT
jgi:rhodanese-related sulfurtransferase